MAAGPHDATPATAERRRTRWTWATVITVGLVSGSALLAVPALADDGSGPSDPAPDTKVVACESGVVDQGGFRTSSASVERVTADAPVPAGCHAE